MVKSWVMPAYLANIVHKDSSIRVSHSDFPARVSPSDPVESWVTLHCHAGGRNLKQQHHETPIRGVETSSQTSMLFLIIEIYLVKKKVDKWDLSVSAIRKCLSPLM